jgi:hypothetical protein
VYVIRCCVVMKQTIHKSEQPKQRMTDATAVRGETLEFSEGFRDIDLTEHVHFWSDFIAGCLAGNQLSFSVRLYMYPSLTY